MKKEILIVAAVLVLAGVGIAVWLQLEGCAAERERAVLEAAMAEEQARREAEQAAMLAAEQARAAAEDEARSKDSADLEAEQRARERALAELERRRAATAVSELEPHWGRRAYACERDADCDTSRRYDGQCCPGCVSAAYAKKFIRALDRHHRQQCDYSECPRRSCGHRSKKMIAVARCIAGRCQETYPHREVRGSQKLKGSPFDDPLGDIDL
jgi:hypothetical protein